MSINIKAVYGDSHEIAGGLEVVRDDLESGFEVTRHHYILREAQVHITGMYAAAIELQAENAALRAKVAELEVGREWLPIESAPMDDEDHPYLVLLPKNDVAPFLTMQVTNFEGRAYPDILNGVIDYDDAVTEATHWMPLPQGLAK